MSYETFINGKSSIKEAHKIIVHMYSLVGRGDEAGFYNFLYDFLGKSNMAFLPGATPPQDVNVLIRMNPEEQSIDEKEEKCLYQSSIIDSMHDFGKLGITSDELKSYPSKSDNYTFTGMMFTLLQNTLYKNTGRSNELSGSYFSSFKASFVDIDKYQNKVSITSDIEDYILLLSIKRGLLRNTSSLTLENIKDETQQCFKITQSVEGADKPKLIEIRSEVEDFFADFRDTEPDGTQKLNILIDTIKNFKRVLTINDGNYPFAHITTRESIHDSAISKTSPLSPNDATIYYRDNIFCEVPSRVDEYSTTLDGDDDVRSYDSSLDFGVFNSIFNIKLGGIKYRAAHGREALGTVSEYENNGNKESFNSILNQSRHPTNTTTVLNEVKSIKSKTSLFLNTAQRNDYRANWGNFDYIYNNIFKNLNYKDHATTFKYSFYYTKKRAGDGLQAEICRRVTNKEEVIRAYKIKTGSGGAIANLSTSTTYILRNLILVTQDRALFSVCITNGVPAILSTYTSYILFKPKRDVASLPVVPESTESLVVPDMTSSVESKTIPVGLKTDRVTRSQKLKGGGNLSETPEEVYNDGSDIADIIDSACDPIYFFRILQKIIGRSVTSDVDTSSVKKYIRYIENFEINEMSEANNEPVFGIYEFLKDHAYFSISSEQVTPEERDKLAKWELIECLYNLKLPTTHITYTRDDTPSITNEVVPAPTYDDVDKISNDIINYFDINANVGADTLITNINLRDENYNPYSIFLGFMTNGRYCDLKVVKIKNDDKHKFIIKTSNSTITFKEITYEDILTYVRFGSHQAMTRKSLKDFISSYSYETNDEEKFFRDILKFIDVREEPHVTEADVDEADVREQLNVDEPYVGEQPDVGEADVEEVNGELNVGETLNSVGGSPFRPNVSFTSLPLLNYYILVFYNLPILVNESANNLVMMSYLNIFENFEVSLCVDDELITENFENGSLFTNKRLLYLFFYHLIDDYGVENVSYNMLEYFLKKHHLDLYFDLYLIIGYVYGSHQLFIPFTPSDIIEKNIQKGIIKLDDISNTQSYFESIYRKAINSNIDKKYFTRNGFMFMSRIFVKKIKEYVKEMKVKEMVDKMEDVQHEMDDVKHEMDDVRDVLSHVTEHRVAKPKTYKSDKRGSKTEKSKRIRMLEKKIKKLETKLKSKRMKSKSSKSKKMSGLTSKRAMMLKTKKMNRLSKTMKGNPFGFKYENTEGNNVL